MKLTRKAQLPLFPKEAGQTWNGGKFMKSVTCRMLSVMLCAVLLLGALSVPAMALNYYGKIGECDDVIVTADELNVRSGPGKQYARVGMLGNGYVARILEIDGSWGRTASGWISLDYVRPKDGGSNNGSSGNNSKPSGRVGYVDATALNVRSGPGRQYQSLGLIGNGYKVNIQSERYGWGKIDLGWICLDYVNFGNPSQNNKDFVGRVIADRLNIRQGAGTGYTRVGQYTYGTMVNILEVQGNWGRTSDGWICMDYIRTA